MLDATNGVPPDGKAAVQDCEGAFDALREILLEVVDGRASSSDLRAPIRQLCVLAQSEDIRAEQLLVRFKELWANLPPLAGLPRGRQKNELMARIATMCIEEYYGAWTGGPAAKKKTT